MTHPPLVDAQPENPFYCPGSPSTFYVDSLLLRLRKNLGSAQRTDVGIRKLYPFPFWEQGYSPVSNSSSSSYGRDSVKRKRSPSCSFSDIWRSSKQARSFQSVHESSFEITIKRERLDYFPSNAAYSPYQRVQPATAKTTSTTLHDLKLRIRTLENELYGPPIGTETLADIKLLVARLDSLLPGIRLESRLLSLNNLTHQKIANVLAENGLLNAQVLDAFRTSEIRSLSLTASLLDQNGLNISGRDSLRVFSTPNSFFFLSELSLCETSIHDSDLAHIHHLPKLATLRLDNTGIGNEAVFLLTSLKRSLTDLSLFGNPRIDDAAIPALIFLYKLSHLVIFDTGIGMNGLRILAAVVSRENRIIDIKIPLVCEQYFNNINRKYMVHPVPPLIVDPALCSKLSIAALRRNLASHATCNRSIIATGTKVEMVERLKKILKTREIDLLTWNTTLNNSVSDHTSSED